MPETSFRSVSGDADDMWVRLNIKLKKSQAVKIMSIIHGSD